MAKKCTQIQMDEQCLMQAQSASGCHARTAESLAACRRLADRGLLYLGPYPSILGFKVFFAHDRNWRQIS